MRTYMTVTFGGGSNVSGIFLRELFWKSLRYSKNIFYRVYTVRSEKYFCKKSKGSYRTRLLFPVRVMPFQIVEGTEPSRLLSSSDLQNKSVKYLRRIKHKKLHNSPQNFNICTLISKCIILETNTSCDGIDLDKISRNWIQLWVLPPSPWRVQF